MPINYYLDELKEKFKKPSQAYIAYQLEKRMVTHAEISPFASEDTKEAINIAKKARSFFDGFALGTVRGSNFNKSVFNLNNKDLGKIMRSKDFINQMQTIGWDTETTIKLLSGTFFLNLKNSADKISSWEELNDIMLAENNITPTPILKNQTLTDMATRFGFQGVAISIREASPETLKKLSDGFSQLAEIVGCQEEQVGMKKCVLGVSNANSDVQGYFAENYAKDGANYIFVNAENISSALAHEWLHMLDREAAKIHGEEGFWSESNEKIIRFLDEEVVMTESVREEIRKEISSRMFKDWVEDYVGYVVDKNSKEKFRSVAILGWEAIKENRFSLKDFEKSIKNLKIRSDGEASKFRKQFAATHMEAFDFAMNTPNYDETMFMTFAKKMDSKKTSYLTENYCTSNLERFARLFERFYIEMANERGRESLLASQGNSFFEQTHAEWPLIKDRWGEVKDLLKEALNKIAPLSINNLTTEVSGESLKSGLEGVKNRLSNLRANFGAEAVSTKLRR